MAQTCSGSSAAADPSRSGIERASAFFNAASAYNAIAAAGSASALCASPGACSQMALSLLDQSLTSQQDNQVSTTGSATQVAINKRFILRRMLERSRALRGVANSGTGNASCGTRNSCLTDAAALLSSISVDIPPASEAPEAARLGCEILDTRWRVNSEIGREREYLYVEDLRRLVSACPDDAAAASDQLAEISFERAERVKEDLVKADPLPSIEASLGAITDYRDTLDTDRFQLPANRGMGAVYQALAKRDPAGTRTYLESAVAAYRNAVTLSASGTPAERAGDYEHLGTSLLSLSKVSGAPGSTERLALSQQAASALQDSINLAPTPARYTLLGDAYEDTGQCTLAIPAYQAGIPGLTGADKISTILSLSSAYDVCGQPDLALQTLKQANAEGDVSADVRYEIGRKEFDKGNFAAALTALRAAESGLNGMQAAEANYMMSVAETITHPDGWQKNALEHAERAVSLNARSRAYNRQACLATILKGGKTVKDGSAVARCPGSGEPEASLLRGMFFLKQAQSMDVSAYNLASQTQWRSILRAAENEFANGLKALADVSDHERVVWFDDLQADVDLAARLQQGQKVIQRCNREITLGPQDPVWNDLNAFYGHYGVLKCS
ncbi:tetratricopeptide repeat protein [Hyphomonas sp.]|uniref:tetratricopeptide repeat protein n=1 Tax=Hyphomonas sp. TaxID=87 RepID=UPI003529366D